jgi:hypothetical protein
LNNLKILPVWLAANLSLYPNYTDVKERDRIQKYVKKKKKHVHVRIKSFQRMVSRLGTPIAQSL